jgi:pyruvate carboxylase subunit B
MSNQGDAWSVQRAGRTWTVEISDERAQSLRQMVGRRKAAGSGGLVKAPMPGLVLRLEVQEGQAVSVGAGLLVLEAMKMENEIRATEAGVINKVLVKAGQAVEKGTVLLELSPT